MTLEAKHRIPLEAIDDNCGLWVPGRLSRQTAAGLLSKGWIKVAYQRTSASGRSTHWFVTITEAGRSAMGAP